MNINVEFQFSESIEIELICHGCGNELSSINYRDKDYDYSYRIPPCKKCLDKMYFEAIKEKP